MRHQVIQFLCVCQFTIGRITGGDFPDLCSQVRGRTLRQCSLYVTARQRLQGVDYRVDPGA
ncbi:hypothetical protein, partial [Pantoea sp. Fr+CA_20]|uniref:hypothetical protein n=1 Tax=Pantoea sp. Fr+CA_20 TaxID=2929506 RepID=UPI002117F9F4